MGTGGRMCFAKKEIESGRVIGPSHPRRLRRIASLLLLAVAAAAVAFVTILFLLVLLRDLPGNIDALLLSCPRCPPEKVGGGGEDSQTTGVCDGGGGGKMIGSSWRNKLVWSFIRRNLLPDCESEPSAGGSPEGGPANVPCAEMTEEERLCRLCTEYREVRSKVRMERLVLSPVWWYRCKLQARNISLAPQRGIFAERPAQDRAGSNIWPGTKDVLRFDIIDRTQSTTNCLIPPPPPAVEIGEVRMEWRSWLYPVVDTHVSDVTFNVVIGTNKSGALGIPRPVVTVGTTPVDEALEMIPDPPEEEGTYPRIGIVNVTNVSVIFHTDPVRSVALGDHFGETDQVEIQPLNCSNADFDELLEKKKRIQFVKVDVPSDYFEALLDATTGKFLNLCRGYFNPCCSV
uniref:Uncharacterized protein n=1 Tax=Odontella aurita TaxID=265563 RepID=A0A7S4JMU2_9STRA|mmetsp:Transcript_49919/g.150133  ORF Transcript_49919/g.150133 Transcript_49919/m.150133 type:complete len:402 (+) Transcript_49919:380-1585(+)